MSLMRGDRGGSVGLTRRQFLATAAALPLAVRARAEVPKPGSGDTRFTFVALGDVHFDRPEHHDMEWLRRDHPNDVAQVGNYSRITREVTPKLFDTIRRLASDPPQGIPVRFAAQARRLRRGNVRGTRPGRAPMRGGCRLRPRGRSGRPVPYDQREPRDPGTRGRRGVQPGAAACPLRTRSARAGAGFVHGRARGCAVRLPRRLRPGRGQLAGAHASEAREPRHRHLFVLLHPPVVPFCARSTWHLYARPADAPRRTRLLNLLGKHQAIVLTAHLHKYGVVVRKTDTGRFLQLALVSVVPRPEVRPRDEVSGLERYGPDLVTLEPRFSPQTEAARREALRAEAPFLTHFEYADAPGYALLSVGEESVTAAIHVGLDTKPWKTLDLMRLLSHS